MKSLLKNTTSASKDIYSVIHSIRKINTSGVSFLITVSLFFIIVQESSIIDITRFWNTEIVNVVDWIGWYGLATFGVILSNALGIFSEPVGKVIISCCEAMVRGIRYFRGKLQPSYIERREQGVISNEDSGLVEGGLFGSVNKYFLQLPAHVQYSLESPLDWSNEVGWRYIERIDTKGVTEWVQRERRRNEFLHSVACGIISAGFTIFVIALFYDPTIAWVIIGVTGIISLIFVKIFTVLAIDSARKAIQSLAILPS